VPRRLGLLRRFVSKISFCSNGEGHVRKADSQVRATHTVASFVLDNAMEMQDERTQCSIVRVWKIVDLLMKRVTTGTWILDSRRVDESIVCSASEQGVWQITEELLEKSCNRANIVVEIGRVAEVEVGRVVVESVTQGVDMRSRARSSVDAFDFETEKVDSLHALVDDHRDSGLIAGEELFEADTEDRT
jgi:hypothetical protein